MSTAAELRHYQAQVEEAMSRALSTGVPELFENEGPGHARVVLSTMLAHASSTLDVVAGTLDAKTWTASDLRRFLSKSADTRIRVLLEKYNGDISESSALYGIVPNAKIEIHALPISLSTHFAIADGKHLRVEHNCETRGAYVTFGGPGDTGGKWCGIFEKLWSLALQSTKSPTLFDSLST